MAQAVVACRAIRQRMGRPVGDCRPLQQRAGQSAVGQGSQVVHPRGFVGRQRREAQHRTVTDEEGERLFGGHLSERRLQQVQIVHRRRRIGGVAREHPIGQREPVVRCDREPDLRLLGIGPVIAAVAVGDLGHVLVLPLKIERSDVVVHRRQIRPAQGQGLGDQLRPDRGAHAIEGIEQATQASVVDLGGIQAQPVGQHAALQPLPHPVERTRGHQSVEHQHLDQSP